MKDKARFFRGNQRTEDEQARERERMAAARQRVLEEERQRGVFSDADPIILGPSASGYQIRAQTAGEADQYGSGIYHVEPGFSAEEHWDRLRVGTLLNELRNVIDAEGGDPGVSLTARRAAYLIDRLRALVEKWNDMVRHWDELTHPGREHELVLMEFVEFGRLVERLHVLPHEPAAEAGHGQRANLAFGREQREQRTAKDRAELFQDFLEEFERTGSQPEALRCVALLHLTTADRDVLEDPATTEEERDKAMGRAVARVRRRLYRDASYREWRTLPPNGQA